MERALPSKEKNQSVSEGLELKAEDSNVTRSKNLSISVTPKEYSALKQLAAENGNRSMNRELHARVRWTLMAFPEGDIDAHWGLAVDIGNRQKAMELVLAYMQSVSGRPEQLEDQTEEMFELSEPPGLFKKKFADREFRKAADYVQLHSDLRLELDDAYRLSKQSWEMLTTTFVLKLWGLWEQTFEEAKKESDPVLATRHTVRLFDSGKALVVLYKLAALAEHGASVQTINSPIITAVAQHLANDGKDIPTAIKEQLDAEIPAMFEARQESWTAAVKIDKYFREKINEIRS